MKRKFHGSQITLSPPPRGEKATVRRVNDVEPAPKVHNEPQINPPTDDNSLGRDGSEPGNPSLQDLKSIPDNLQGLFGGQRHEKSGKPINGDQSRPDNRPGQAVRKDSEANSGKPSFRRTPIPDHANAADYQALGTSMLDMARYEDIARRLLMQQPIEEIGREIGITGRHVRRILQEPGMEAVFLRVKDALLSNVDEIIMDEKLAPLLRARGAAIRSLTVLNEIMNDVQEKVHTGQARASEMKVAADVAFGLIDRSKTELSGGSSYGGNNPDVNVRLNLSIGKDAILRDSISESGVDLSDIIDVTPREVYDAPTEEE